MPGTGIPTELTLPINARTASIASSAEVVHRVLQRIRTVKLRKILAHLSIKMKVHADLDPHPGTDHLTRSLPHANLRLVRQLPDELRSGTPPNQL